MRGCVLLVLAMAMLGCAENEAATKKCKGASGSSDDCEDCCSANGANGHKYVNGDCACLGG